MAFKHFREVPWPGENKYPCMNDLCVHGMLKPQSLHHTGQRDREQQTLLKSFINKQS